MNALAAISVVCLTIAACGASTGSAPPPAPPEAKTTSTPSSATKPVAKPIKMGHLDIHVYRAMLAEIRTELERGFDAMLERKFTSRAEIALEAFKLMPAGWFPHEYLHFKIAARGIKWRALREWMAANSAAVKAANEHASKRLRAYMKPRLGKLEAIEKQLPEGDKADVKLKMKAIWEAAKPPPDPTQDPWDGWNRVDGIAELRAYVSKAALRGAKLAVVVVGKASLAHDMTMQAPLHDHQVKQRLAPYAKLWVGVAAASASAAEIQKALGLTTLPAMLFYADSRALHRHLNSGGGRAPAPTVRITKRVDAKTLLKLLPPAK